MSSKQERAYAAIRSGIIGGRYGGGYRLVLDDLGRELGFSTVPVREAIRRLEAEGLVRFERNVGARVISFDPDQFDSVMRGLAVLEGHATALAAGSIRESQLDGARKANEQIRAAAERHDPIAVSRANRRFHTSLHDSCPNSYILDLVRQTWDRMDLIRSSIFLYIPARALESAFEHDALLELITARAPSGEIEAFVRAHELRTADSFARACDEAAQEIA